MAATIGATLIMLGRAPMTLITLSIAGCLPAEYSNDYFFSLEVKMFLNVAKNSSQCADFDWIVTWDCHMVLTPLNRREP